jgi:hypothetical protein
MMQEFQIAQEHAQILRIVLAELLAIPDRQLERRALQMADQDFEIVGIDLRVLR